jgi:aldehyde:ferredoxin oxidoreductase
MFGYAGKILQVDLTHRKISSKPLKKSFCQEYIGGNGFSIRLLFDHAAPNIDPLSSDNPLIFAVGPFAGTMVPTSGKYVVQAKSPLSNLMGESVSSGSWGPTLKRAGWDAIIIKGKSEKPIYLFIDDNVVLFKDARNIWGKENLQTANLITEELQDDSVCVATIGPAGENLVSYANITNDRYRQAGRTGMGAVMGSKNLKAIAVRGSNKVEVHNLEKLMKISHTLYKGCQGLGTENYRIYGTPASVSILNELSALPTRNWQEATFELAEQISGEYIKDNYLTKILACSGCPIACDHIFTVKGGPFDGEVGSIEFESIYALGSECGIGYFPAIVKATNLCDELGLDTISTGVTIGWAMECFEKGLLTKNEMDEIDLTFGNYTALIKIIKKIAYRRGIGNLLAEGSKKASKKIGKNSGYFAMHNKGLECPGYDLRGLKASALGFNTSTRGGCHLRSSMYTIDFSKNYNRLKSDERYGKLTMEKEDLLSVFDSLVICKFIRKVLPAYEQLSELYTTVTGLEMNPKLLRKAGERIYTLEKLYNIREGWTKKDDYPPPRIMLDPIPSGASKGSVVKKEEFELMLNSYYKERNWNLDGIPSKQKLAELGLEPIDKVLNPIEEN